MARSLSFILALVLVANAICTCATSILSQQQQIPLSADDITVRPAVEADLDDFVTIFIDAFLPGPAWQYIYTNAEQYKDFWWHCLRQDLAEQYARRPNNTFINVIAKPSHDVAEASGSDGKVDRVVAIAIWKLLASTSNESQKTAFASLVGLQASLTKCSDHPELNSTRAYDVKRQMQAIERRYIHDPPEDQLYLALLATHPSWDGHGFGAAHLDWGFEKARQMSKRVPITLLATPAGWPLYDSAGFKSVDNITVTTLDDDIDDLWLEYMRFDEAGDEL